MIYKFLFYETFLLSCTQLNLKSLSSATEIISINPILYTSLSPITKHMIPEYLLKSTQLFVVALDVDGKINLTGAKFEEEFPIFKREYLNKSMTDFLEEREQYLFEFLLSELLESPKKSKQVFLNLSNSKKINWEFSVLKSEEGDIEGILGIGQEVFVKTLGIDHVETLFKNSGISVCTVKDVYLRLNEHWELTYANEQAQRFFGKCSSAILNKTIWQIYPSKKIHQTALQFKKAKQEQDIIVFEEYRSDINRWYQVYLINLAGELHAILKDVTDMHVEKSQMAQAKLDLRNILDHSEESIFMIDLGLNITEYNQNAKDLVRCHFRKDLSVGDDFLPYLMSGLEEQFLKDLEMVFSGKSITYEKEVFNCRTNEELWFEHKFYPLFNTDKKVCGFVYANKNIVEKKQEYKRVEEKNKVLREVAYIQSHMLRSPLSSMLGLLDLIDKKQLDAENTKYFSYLKPLAQELDMVIRENARKVNEFD